MKGTFIDFMKLASENPELAQELVDLATKYDFQFTEQVTDEQLEGVAGGVDAGTFRVLKINLPAPTSSAFPRSSGDESGSATGSGVVTPSYLPKSGGDVKGTGGGT